MEVVARIQQRELLFFELKKLTRELEQIVIETRILLEENISIASDLHSIDHLKPIRINTESSFLQKFFLINANGKLQFQQNPPSNAI